MMSDMKTTSDSPPTQLHTYQFEIEKYLEQMTGNPYLRELEEDLANQKNTKLIKLINDECIQYLDNDLIERIYAKCTNDDGLITFCTSITNYFNNHALTLSEKLSHISNHIKLYESQVSDVVELNPTQLRISTMTACCNVGVNIDTKYLYDSYSRDPNTYMDLDVDRKTKYKSDSRGIIGCKAENYPIKGHFQKDKKSNFFNSAALNILVKDNKCTNLKVFKNGQIQMTGVPDEETGHFAVNMLLDLLKSIPDNDEGRRIVSDKKRLCLSDYKTVLINSDYFCGVEIQRENLNQVLFDKYDMAVSYESENYPGVKLEYFWNRKYLNTLQEGRCVCSKKCIGKGGGDGDMDCKKITISTFQSGKVIVTGGRTLEQLDNAYKFINKIFVDNYDFVRKKTKTNKDKIYSSKNTENTKFYFLKKINIKNYGDYTKMIDK